MLKKADNNRCPEIDVEAQKQKAIMEYRRLSRLEKSSLSLDEQLSIENIKAAMQYLWRYSEYESTP